MAERDARGAVILQQADQGLAVLHLEHRRFIAGPNALAGHEDFFQKRFLGNADLGEQLGAKLNSLLAHAMTGSAGLSEDLVPALEVTGAAQGSEKGAERFLAHFHRGLDEFGQCRRCIGSAGDKGIGEGPGGGSDGSRWAGGQSGQRGAGFRGVEGLARGIFAACNHRLERGDLSVRFRGGNESKRPGEFGFILTSRHRFGQAGDEGTGAAGFTEQFRQHVGTAPGE